MIHDWDWKLAGGAWPTIDEIVKKCKPHKHASTVDRPLHFIEELPHYYWKRIDDEGKIDYDLVEYKRCNGNC